MKRKITIQKLTLFLLFTLAFACKKSTELNDVAATSSKSKLRTEGITGTQILIVPNVRAETGQVKESGFSFECSNNTVLTGRYHSGDENGKTAYEYATLKAIDAAGNPVGGVITVEDQRWEGNIKESNGTYNASAGRVIVGRRHSGDENGQTAYKTGVVKYNGLATTIINYTTSGINKESKWNWFKTDGTHVITGRSHSGDENGNTYYSVGTIAYNTVAVPPSRFRIVVKLNPSESYFPMNPNDFIRLSRFRKHNIGSSDDGWSKSQNFWVNGNSHGLEYYDIPVNIINSYYIPNSTKNLRPHDSDSFGVGEVFLEPDDNLVGDRDPNTRVPVFQYSLPDGSKRQYWTFYGYDQSSFGISVSHQGDWENITLSIVNNSIAGAWLSQHNDDPYYPKENLIITEANGVQTLTVYSATGSHAFYNYPGDYHTILDLDHAADGGYQWVITDNVQDLSTQPWRDYAGAWGEVGEFATTTGPLGPWYKRLGFNGH
jgi:hypothetical protein